VTAASPAERGTTTIADAVVAQITGEAAHEVEGVHTTGAGVRHGLAELGVGNRRTHGVEVEVGTREAAADIETVLDYGVSVPRVTQELRDHVKDRVERLTGLEVVEVNVVVSDLHIPEDDVEKRRRTDRDPNQQPELVQRLQRRRRTYREHGVVYRSLWVLAGFTIAIAGIVMIAFPGPAFLVIPIGLAMLSLEFAWAQRLLDTGVNSAQLATRRLEQASTRTKVLGAGALALAALAVVTLLLALL
jgi:uncharacterized protein (TIGR02611 family)